mgnify:CR=1 FL=1
MKRTMKKAMSILAASAVLALTLAGCGNESTDPATTDGSGTDSASTVSGTVATNGSTSMEKVIGTQDFIEMQIGGWDGCKNPDGSFEAELQIIIASTIANGFNKLAARGY